MKVSRVSSRLVLFAVISVGSLTLSVAGGPRAVNGAGDPMKWSTVSPVGYNPDQGPLGLLPNPAARLLLAEAFAEWAAGPATISFVEGASLPFDVNAAGIPFTNPGHYKHFYRINGDGLAPVIFDTDGSIIDAFFGEGARFDVVGVAGIDTPIGLATEITGASIIVNGAFYDGVGLPASPPDLTLDGLKAAMVHEIGHFINLDHSVVNHELALDGSPGNDVYVPTMFPVLVADEGALASTNPDDELAAQNLYPAGAPASDISGTVYQATVPFQGANVVLRNVADPLMSAYSVISGGFYFPCLPGTSCNPCQTTCVDPPLRGEFGVAFLPVGQYSVCVEQIDTRFSLSNASFVGPRPSPAIVPGPEECFDVEEAGIDEDNPDTSDPVTPGGGVADIHLNHPPFEDFYEPNDSLGSGAALIDLPSGQDTGPGHMVPPDLDVFNVPVVAGQRVRVDIDAAEIGSTLDAVVGFYNASNVLVALVDDAIDPDSGQLTFDPALELVAGFTGTAKVVVASYPDTDLNGIGGATSGGYWIRVEVATDTDGDGAVDGEDPCPATPRDDADGDTICFGDDNCPTLANPNQVSPAKASGTMVAGGDVDSVYLVSPDGSWVVYRADQDTDGFVELYSAPAAGGTPVKLSDGGSVDGLVRISGDSDTVVYSAGGAIFAVPIAGGPTTMLAPGGSFNFDFTPDGARVVYWTGALRSVPIEGGGSTLLSGGPVNFVWRISPDSSRVVFTSDVSGSVELYSTPTDGGSTTKLNGTLVPGGFVHDQFAISPDSSQVVYRARQDSADIAELYVVALGGGASTKLSQTLAVGGAVDDPKISPDSTRVVYEASESGPSEYFSVALSGGTPVRLNPPGPAGGVSGHFLTADSTRVVYRNNQFGPTTSELFSVPIAGGAVVKLNPTLAPGGNVGITELSRDGTLVVFQAETVAVGSRRLFVAPVAGGAATALTPSLPSSRTAHVFRTSGNDETVVYWADAEVDERYELYRVSLDGTGTRKLSGTLVPGGDVDSGFAVSPTSSTVAYRADEIADEVSELFVVDAVGGRDADSDSILDGCDICPAVPNVGQDDLDGDGVGDACQPCPVGADPDGDLVCGEADNCPELANAGQTDTDGDGAGNACDGDDDNDGLLDVVETDTGTFVDSSNTGSDPLDSDSDDDGVDDGDEVAAGTDPNSPVGALPRVPFDSGTAIEDGTADLAAAAVTADIDGDGDLDVLFASSFDDTIAWRPNLDGRGSFGPRQPIPDAGNYPRSVATGDLDRDGDVDVLAVSAIDQRLAWHENANGFGTSWVTRTIATGISARSVAIGDVNRDGRPDAIVATNTLQWFESGPGSPIGWTPHAGLQEGGVPLTSVWPADMDGDGDLDLLVSKDDFENSVAWYVNDGTPEDPIDWTEFEIHDYVFESEFAMAADLDGDGDLDAISTTKIADAVMWHENDGDSPPGWTLREIHLGLDDARQVDAEDMDGDGDLDVLAVSPSGDIVKWYESDGGLPPQFTPRNVSGPGGPDGPETVHGADIDGDGDTDVLVASPGDDSITWFENLTIHRNATHPVMHPIASGLGTPNFIDAGDGDGDGDADLLVAETQGDRIVWYRNNAPTPSWTALPVVSATMEVDWARWCDLDRDGDLDVIYASTEDDTVGWAENNGGATPAFTDREISTAFNYPHAVTAADFDGDGDPDLVASWRLDDKLAWFRNEGGTPLVFTLFDIPKSAPYARGLATGDMDGDGDIDIVAAVVSIGRLAWFENEGGVPIVWTERTLAPPGIGVLNFVEVADVNGDGHLDAVSGAYNGFDVAWFENDGAAQPTFTTRSIATPVVGWVGVEPADIDADGDIDIVGTSSFTQKLAVFENDGGDPPVWTRRDVSSGSFLTSAVDVGDFDGDGDVDLATAAFGPSWRVDWWENRGGQFSLTTTSLAPATVRNGDTVPVLAIDFAYHGREGDPSAELSSLDLLLTDGTGGALSNAETGALLDRVRIYRDDGTATFELERDTLIATVEDPAPSPLLISFAPGDPRVRLGPGESRRLFVVAEIGAHASIASPNTLRVTHRTSPGGIARDATSGAVLRMAPAADLATGPMSAVGDFTRPFVTGAFPEAGAVDVARGTDVVLFVSEPVDPETLGTGVWVSVAGVKLEGSASLSADGRVIVFDPDGPLTLGATCTLQVGTALRDLAGNPALPFTSVFEVTSDASAGQIDPADLGEGAGGSVLEGSGVNDNSGFANAALRDVNGTVASNGIADLLIGAPNADAGAPDSGKATLVFGSPGLQSSGGSISSLVYRTGSTQDFVGKSVAPAGDVDADGVHDFLIGAPQSDLSGTDAGAVYLVFGDPGLDEVSPGPLDLDDLAACTVPTLCGVRFTGAAPWDLAGAAVAYAGDVNADGFDDILIGAPGADPGGRDEAGKVYLIYGPLDPGTVSLSTVGSTIPGLVFHGENEDDRAGESVSAWEDDRVDGIDDLLIGAPGATTLDEFGIPSPGSGWVYAIHGGLGPGRLDDTTTPGVIELARVASGGTGQVAGMVFLGTRAGGALGRSMTGSADTDGDGIDDVLLAANGEAFVIPGDGPKIVTGGTRTGGRSAVVVGLARTLGPLDAIDDFGAARYAATAADEEDPLTIGAAGDLDGDGYDDFIVGAPLADGVGMPDAGRAYVILGTPAPPTGERALADVGETIAGFVVVGAAESDGLGASVGGGADVNGDGADDGLVGAPFADTAPQTEENAGETYVISPVRPEEVTPLLLEKLPAAVRIEWPVTDLAASYNVYRGLLSAVRAGAGVRTGSMTSLACAALPTADADGDQLPDTDDLDAPPAVGDAHVYLVSARNALGEGPLGAGIPPRLNDAQCP